MYFFDIEEPVHNKVKADSTGSAKKEPTENTKFALVSASHRNVYEAV